MTTRITSEGLYWKRLLSGRERLLRWDDIASVDGAAIVTRTGERIRAGATDLEIARGVLATPALGSGDTRDTFGKRLTGHLSRPFAAAATASALVHAASELGASDVHLAFDANGAGIRVRIDGELGDLARASTPAAERLAAALKGLAGCLPYRRDVVQEGRIPRDGIAADVRASFVPTAFGERVALRLFGRLRLLSELGLAAADLAALEQALRARKGLLLIGGSSGAGKTTTLYAALAKLAATRTGAHLSLEDPVEQRLRAAGVPVDQVELDPAQGRTGEAMLAAALRQDVDVIAVGEVRTPAEALLAVHAAHTGRLVLAGVHAGSAAETRQRLLDLGAPAPLVDATLVCAVHQDLEMAPCGCATGCGECRHTGRRRRAVMRFLSTTGASIKEQAA